MVAEVPKKNAGGSSLWAVAAWVVWTSESNRSEPQIAKGATLWVCHTTRHAGPHRTVREVEVMRAGAVPADPTSSGSTRR
jgi:hypothetical protein